MIVVRNLNVKYGNRYIISNLDMTARGITVVVGPNGVGKSTLLRAIAGGIKAKGYISINGKIVLSEKVNLPPEKRDVAYLPQHGGPIPTLKVRECLELVGYIDYDVIDALNIAPILELKGKELSGGQRRKVGIAMIIMSNKKAWLLDEPLAGIDPQSRAHVASIIAEYSKKKSATVLLVSHLREAEEIADEVLNLGR